MRCSWSAACRCSTSGGLSLTALSTYLHQRTGGMIGSLSHLIRGAAIEAILDGTEQITKRLLETIDLDHAAQHPGTARS